MPKHARRHHPSCQGLSYVIICDLIGFYSTVSKHMVAQHHTGPSQHPNADMRRVCRDAADVQARPPKRQKLRIAAGRATGSRVVFDDQGLEQAPLEQLGSRLEDR